MLSRPKTMENHHIYKFFDFQQSGSIENSDRMEEFNEEDIWGNSIDPETKQVGFQENGCNGVALCRSMGNEGNSNNIRRSVKIPRKESCHEENSRRRRARYRSSAPVNIPDWSQMVWKDKTAENYWKSHGVDDSSDDEEDNDVKDFERIPPHELIARQLAQRYVTSFSVYEGVGKALKGRDLCRVRNAVWMRTGFID